MKRYLTLPILIVVIITVVAATWLILQNRSTSPNNEMSTAGVAVPPGQTGKIYTTAPASSLQAAEPPAHSTTSAGLNPQQAQPNYCTAGEAPIIDGCIQQ